MKRFYTYYLLPIALIAGAIIGAGIFSLPYVFWRVGFVTGLLYLGVATFAYAGVYLMYADIILQTPGHHRFVGYARRYGGEGASWLATLIAVVQMIFVLTIFLVLALGFLNVLIPAGNELLKLLGFWFIGSILIFATLRRVARLEFFVTLGIIAIISVVFVTGFFRGEGIAPLSNSFTRGIFFFPLAPLLFALAGRIAIPAVIEYFSVVHAPHRSRLITRTILLGTIVPALVYILFVAGVLLLTPNPSEDSISGLVSILPSPLLGALGVLGILSLLGTYLMMGVNVNNILKLDLSFNIRLRVLIVVVAPLLIYFAGFRGFLSLASFVGGIFVSLEALLLIFLWRAARNRTHEASLLGRAGFLVAVIAVFVFVSAFIAEVVLLFGLT